MAADKVHHSHGKNKYDGWEATVHLPLPQAERIHTPVYAWYDTGTLACRRRQTLSSLQQTIHCTPHHHHHHYHHHHQHVCQMNGSASTCNAFTKFQLTTEQSRILWGRFGCKEHYLQTYQWINSPTGWTLPVFIQNWTSGERSTAAHARSLMPLTKWHQLKLYLITTCFRLTVFWHKVCNSFTVADVQHHRSGSDVLQLTLLIGAWSGHVTH